MKILHLNTYDHGGAANAAIRLHLGLRALGMESSFMSLHKTRSDLPAHFALPPEAIIPAPDKVITLKNYLSARFGKAYKAYEKREKEIQKLNTFAFQTGRNYISHHQTNYRIHLAQQVQQADIIHLHWVADFIDYATFFPNIEKPIVWTLHDENPYRGAFHYESDEATNQHPGLQQYDQQVAHPQKAGAIQSARHLEVITPSQWLGRQARRSAAFLRRTVSVIPYGMPTEVFKPYPQSFAREVFQLPPEQKILLFVSQSVHNQRKGFDLLLEALQQVSSSEELCLCAVGAVPAEAAHPNIRYLGTIQDERLMALAYAAADAFILPSREDNLPNTMLEALCCGTPVIGFPIGGIPDAVHHGENGLLATEVSATALAAEINRFLMGEISFNRPAIRAAADRRFALHVQARAYREVYERLLAHQ